jgi:hypothetical protein
MAERAFVFKLLKRNPDVTEAETHSATRDWYATRPETELGDGVEVPGDPNRFES